MLARALETLDVGAASLPLVADFPLMQISTVMQENKRKQTKRVASSGGRSDWSCFPADLVAAIRSQLPLRYARLFLLEIHCGNLAKKKFFLF